MSSIDRVQFGEAGELDALRRLFQRKQGRIRFTQEINGVL